MTTSDPQIFDWKQTIRSCLKSGGKLVFIDSRAPENFQDWLASVTARLLPVLVVSADLILKGHFKTQVNDLVLAWDDSLFTNKEINQNLQGTRVLLSSSGFDSNWIDHHWRGISLSLWKEFFSGFQFAGDGGLNFPQMQPQPCLFLDRDDVIIKNVPYNSDPSLVTLLPGAADLINHAHSKNYWVAMVSNQSGLARGKISWSQYQQVHQQTLRLLAAEGAWLDECLWASGLPEAETEAGQWGLSLRKPRSGMFQLVDQKLGVDFPRSVMIGDSATDLIAAYGVAVGGLYLLKSEKAVEQQEELKIFSRAAPDFAYSMISNLADVKNSL